MLGDDVESIVLKRSASKEDVAQNSLYLFKVHAFPFDPPDRRWVNAECGNLRASINLEIEGDSNSIRAMWKRRRMGKGCCGQSESEVETPISRIFRISSESRPSTLSDQKRKSLTRSRKWLLVHLTHRWEITLSYSTEAKRKKQKKKRKQIKKFWDKGRGG